MRGKSAANADSCCTDHQRQQHPHAQQEVWESLVPVCLIHTEQECHHAGLAENLQSDQHSSLHIGWRRSSSPSYLLSEGDSTVDVKIAPRVVVCAVPTGMGLGAGCGAWQHVMVDAAHCQNSPASFASKAIIRVWSVVHAHLR